MSRATEFAVSKPSQEIPLPPHAAAAEEREDDRDGAAVLAMQYVLGHPVASPLAILLAFEVGRIVLERALTGDTPRWTHPSHWIPLAVLGPLLLVLFPLLSWIRTRQAEQAKALVLESLEQSEQIQKISILGFARLSEVHDSETGNHIVRMAHYSLALARELGRQPDFSSYITRRYCDDLFIAAPLHDIGKVGIIDGILKKKGLLSPEEYEIMKMHTILGGNLLEELERKLPFRTFYSLGKSIAYHHHQCWDGSGYPNVFIGNSYFVESGVGTPLKGEEIPLSARIVALADVYDALVSRRCYKEPIPPERAREMIFSKSGSQFDPTVVAAFHRIEDEFLRIGREFRD